MRMGLIVLVIPFVLVLILVLRLSLSLAFALGLTIDEVRRNRFLCSQTPARQMSQ